MPAHVVGCKRIIGLHVAEQMKQKGGFIMLKKQINTLTVFALLLISGTSFAEDYKIDPAHSNVGFTIRHIVSRVSGKFSDVSGMVSYDPKAPEKFMAHATIQTTSINTDNDSRDNHLRSPDFFDVAKYPEITFKSTKAKKEGDRLMVTGDLTMHGITKSIVLAVEVLGVGNHPMSKAPMVGLAAELTLQRSDFGVNNWTDAAGILGDEVKITLNIEGMGGKQANPCAKGMTNPCNPCGKAMKNPCNPCGKKMKNPCAK